VTDDSDATRAPASAEVAFARQRRRRYWKERWAKVGIDRPKWFDRGVAPEIVEAVDSGWLPGRGRVLDIGCGQGDVAAWFAKRGYEATGADFTEACRVASRRHADRLGRNLRFLALDITDVVPADERYDIVIDYGCLHGMRDLLVERYVGNISSMAPPGARMLLFMKAFRGGEPFGDETHMRERADWVRRMFAGRFAIESHRPVYMNKGGTRDPSRPLPGLLFRLERLGRAG